MIEITEQPNKSMWDITTVCPMDFAFGFPLGATQNNAASIKTLKKIVELVPEIHIDITESVRSNELFSGSEYISINEDVSTIRLFRWECRIESSTVVFHVFPNHIAVGEVKLTGLAADSADALDKLALKRSETLLTQAKNTVSSVMRRLEKELKSTNVIIGKNETIGKIYWPSRILQLSESDLSNQITKNIISDWLADTQRPNDDQKLISGEIKESITWLKYIMVDVNKTSDYRVDALILAQYCYTAQEKCNRNLRQSIEWAFQGEKRKLESEIQRAKNSLEKSRMLVKLHQVSVNECLRHLTRRKSKLVKDIFACWEYDRLVNNGNLMLDLCADKISESNSRQAKISASKTEYILIGISLFTVLEFFFFITQFSREAMANPTLDHNDGGPSGFLSIVADVPADLMFFVAVMIAGLIFVVYKKVRG